MHSVDGHGSKARPEGRALDLALCHRGKDFQLPGPKAWNDKLSKPVHFAEEKTIQPEQKNQEPFLQNPFSLERISFSRVHEWDLWGHFWNGSGYSRMANRFWNHLYHKDHAFLYPLSASFLGLPIAIGILEVFLASEEGMVECILSHDKPRSLSILSICHLVWML